MKFKREISFLYIEVLQNGASMCTLNRRVPRTGSLAVTNKPDDDLAIPHYPLPNNKLEFLTFQKGRTNLVVAHNWEGFCTSGGTLVNFARGDKGRQTVELKQGDYASITSGDLRIMIKITRERHQVRKHRPRETAKYRAPVFSILFPDKSGGKSLAAAFAIAATVFGGFVIGLLKRNHVAPQTLGDLHPDYVLPFVHPEHMLHAPEALQTNLDRQNMVRNIVEYYQSVTSVLSGQGAIESRYLFPTSVGLYSRLHDQARARLDEMREVQRQTDDFIAAQPRIAQFVIPSARGESVVGQSLRIIDKISIMHQSFAAALQVRQEIVKVFPDDPVYDYEEYRNPTAARNDTAKEYLGKIRPWNRSTDEELMYQQAKDLAGKARFLQRRSSAGTVNPGTFTPVGVQEQSKGYTYISYGLEFGPKERLYALTGGPYSPGRRQHVAAAPLPGEIEPHLVEKYIRQNKFQLQLCYELALRRNENAAGKMEWRWTIDPRGEVSDVALVESSINDPKMNECVRSKIATWKFPRPRRGSVEISYPFDFSPTKG